MNLSAVRAHQNPSPISPRQEAPAETIPAASGRPRADSPQAAGKSETGVPRHRIALLGLFGIGNMGNDASMETMLRFLRERAGDCSIHCLSVDPEAIHQTYGVDTVRINYRFRSRLLSRLDRMLFSLPRGIVDTVRTIRAARRFDLLIAPGTGLLDDFGTGPFNWPYTLLKWSVAARLSGARIWLVSIGAGPIENPLSRWMMKTAARLATYRSYRDRISLEFMESIGFDAATDAVYPDVVFKMDEPDAIGTLSDRLIVGVGVMGYKGWRASADKGAEIYASYISRITSFIVWLLDNSHDVRIFTGARSDGDTVAEIIRRLVETRPQLRDRYAAIETSSLDELMKGMSATDIVVATRFHNIVCSLKVGKPTISIGYARKNDELMTQFGLAKYCHYIEDFEVERLKAQLTEISQSREEVSASIRCTVEALKSELKRQDQHLLSTMLGRQ